MRRFHFSIGNSSEGPVGACITVRAGSEEEALKVLEESLQDCYQALSMDDAGGVPDGESGILEINTYFNTHAIKAEDIEDVTAEDGEGEEDEDEEESDEPDEDSITTKDHAIFYQYGRRVFSYSADSKFLVIESRPGRDQWSIAHIETVEDAICRYMDEVRFYPDVWWISDHGNAHRIDLSQAAN